MVHGPLPGERLFAWPHSRTVRDLLRFTSWLAAIAWFFAPPYLAQRALPPSVVFWVAALLSAITLLIWGRWLHRPRAARSESRAIARSARLRRGISPGRLPLVVEPNYSIKALDESTLASFAALVERNNGIFGGCWCMGFHPEGGGKDATAAGNRRRKLDRVRAGTAHAALVFDGDDCVGWCQFGAPDEVARIKSRAAYEKELVTLPRWRIGCCYVGKGHRRQGVATAALSGALDLIAGLGGGTVEGYPEDAGSVSAGFLFNGALSTYEKLGFTRDRKIGKHRWVLTAVVEPAS